MEILDFSTFRPQQCISSKVMRLNRVIANIFRKHLQPFGVTDSQLSLLFILSKTKDRNQKQLSEMAVLEKSSLHRNLKRLLAADLIVSDHARKINITEKGKLLVSAIIPEWEKAMKEAAQLLQPDGLDALGVLLVKISSK
ncbi:MarR family winged helix-turn-helix transcriptional regulator [Maribacter sp. 2-571]|uniref:MarR family winged helix-turn-helix transcriptional regulator n=1 Tax=Maribacter sp. 2-571 TaxID=3417569 RepID=UPI003D34F871